MSKKTFLLYFKCILLILCVLNSQNKLNATQDSLKPNCYTRGEMVKDTQIPCCTGLQKVTEVNTNRLFCDKPADNRSKNMVMLSLFIFPVILIIFILFGIRNKYTKKKAQ